MGFSPPFFFLAKAQIPAQIARKNIKQVANRYLINTKISEVHVQNFASSQQKIYQFVSSIDKRSYTSQKIFTRSF